MHFSIHSSLLSFSTSVLLYFSSCFCNKEAVWPCERLGSTLCPRLSGWARYLQLSLQLTAQIPMTGLSGTHGM